MPRKPIPELPPDAPEPRRADDDDVPVAMEYPADMPPDVRYEAEQLAAGQGGLITPSQASVLMALSGRTPLSPVVDSLPLSACPTNIDLKTPLGKALAFAAGSAGDIEPDPRGQARILATHWIVFPDRRPDEETGEMQLFARTVFIDRQGRTLRTSAQSGPERMMQLLWLYDAADWAKGIPLIITARPSRRHKGGTWHDIRVDVEAFARG